MSETEPYDLVAETYDNFYRGKKCAAEDRFVFGTVRDHIGAARTVLDIGCGTANFLDCVPFDGDYTGIDPSGKMLEVAQRKHPRRRFLQMKAEQLPSLYRQPTFDAVISLFGSFSYVLEPETVLAHLHRITKPGGRLVLMVNSPKNRQDGSYIMASAKTVPRRQFKPVEFHRLVEMAGFQYVRSTAFGLVLDHLPECAPSWLFDLTIAVERRLVPDRCWHVIATAEKGKF